MTHLNAKTTLAYIAKMSGIAMWQCPSLRGAALRKMRRTHNVALDSSIQIAFKSWILLLMGQHSWGHDTNVSKTDLLAVRFNRRIWMFLKQSYKKLMQGQVIKGSAQLSHFAAFSEPYCWSELFLKSKNLHDFTLQFTVPSAVYSRQTTPTGNLTLLSLFH